MRCLAFPGVSVAFRGWPSAGAAPLLAAGRLLEAGRPLVAGRGAGVAVGALAHLLADGVHQFVEHLLHVDVVFGAGLEELEAWR